KKAENSVEDHALLKNIRLTPSIDIVCDEMRDAISNAYYCPKLAIMFVGAFTKKYDYATPRDFLIKQLPNTCSLITLHSRAGHIMTLNNDGHKIADLQNRGMPPSIISLSLLL